MGKSFVIHTASDGVDHVEIGGMGRIKHLHRAATQSDGEFQITGIYRPEAGELVKGTLSIQVQPWDHDSYRDVRMELRGPDGGLWGLDSYTEDGAS